MNPTTVGTFAEALEPTNYVRIPDDWFVAVGDVVQSTPAIAAGRYKDVNLAGAATIAAIMNACPGTELPFAFGGDGGSVLVPSNNADAARAALKGVQKLGRSALSLDLRCALLPIGAIRAQGRDIRIAYQAIGPARRLAMLCGGGLDKADAMAKTPADAAFMLQADESTEDADLTGLSCRYQPLKSRTGVMLSIIVRARDDASPLSPTYREVYRRIQGAIAGDPCPIVPSSLKFNWPPRGAAQERALGASLFQTYGVSLIAKISEKSGMTIAGYNGRAYTGTLRSHTDYLKFADSLRMVLDCSVAEADRIEAILKDERARGRIDFGLHRATAALMTCFVPSPQEGKHVHFIDGADGGYAMAAQELKAQLQSGA